MFTFSNRRPKPLEVPDNPAMSTANGAAANPGKRTVTEVTPQMAGTSHLNSPSFNLHGPHFPSPTIPPLNRSSQVQQILNNAAPFGPFSFTSLLTAVDDINGQNPPITNTTTQNNEIDQILFLHSQNLLHAVVGMIAKHHQFLLHAADESAAKKMKGKELDMMEQDFARNAELEKMVERYIAEVERLRIRERYLERAVASLSESIRDANAAQIQPDTALEEAQSSLEDEPDRVTAVRLDCKICERRLATVMMMPCRHISVCTGCEVAAVYCPVCNAVKTTGIEVYLPRN